MPKGNWTGQKNSRFLCKAKVYYHVHMSPPNVCTKLCHISLHPQILFHKRPYLYYPTRSLSLNFSDEVTVCVLLIQFHKWYMPCASCKSDYYFYITLFPLLHGCLFWVVSIYGQVLASGREHNLYPDITAILKIFPSVLPNIWL